MEAIADNHKTPKRAQLSLRAVLILVTVICAFFAGRASMFPSLELEEQRARDARQAAAVVAKQYEEMMAMTLLERMKAIDRAERHNEFDLHSRLDVTPVK